MCEALLRLTTMGRAALFLYDSARQRVSRGGLRTGFIPALLAGCGGTLDETPVAQRRPGRGPRASRLSERLERAVPPATRRFAGITTLV